MGGRFRIAAGLLGGTAMLCSAAPASADTLREALEATYETNPSLQAARADLRATDENVPIAKADGRPSVDLNGRYTEFLVQNAASFTAPERAVNGGLDLGIPLYTGGAVSAAVDAAETRVIAGRADLRGTESMIFNQVVAAYMDVLRGQALVALQANQVEVLRVNVEATSDRFEIGDLTRTDVAQSQSRLALAEGDFRNAQANLIGARETYIELVGQAPTNLQPPPPLPNLPDSPEMAVDVALENNPDLIGARQRAEAAGYDIAAASAGRSPRISVVTGYGYQNFLGTLGGTGTGVVIPQVANTLQAGVQVTLPLIQGGRTAALERQAQARSGAALERIIATERNIISQVRAAYASYRSALAIIDSSLTAVSSAELSLEGVRAENSIGNRTVLDVLNAEQELLNAQVQLVTARRNAYVAGFSLLAAMGLAEARDLGLEGGTLYDPITNYDRVEGKWWDFGRDPDPEATATRTVDIPAPNADIPDQIAPVYPTAQTGE